MDRDNALNLIVNKDWKNLLSVLKDNRIFDDLINDQIFNNLFNEHFIYAFLNDFDSNEENRILQLTAIYNFHKSNSYKFSLQKEDLEKLVIKLVELTGNYVYAKEFPLHPVCESIIKKHEKEEQEKIKFLNDNFTINSNLNIVELDFNKQNPSLKTIFNSPQELEFYKAAKLVFRNEIILPNAALSTVIDNSYLDKLEKQEKWLFLTTTIDLVIVDNTTYRPIFFFELDSRYHDTPEQTIKDNLKNKIIGEAGFKLFRARKINSGDKTDHFVKWLSQIKSS